MHIHVFAAGVVFPQVSSIVVRKHVKHTGTYKCVTCHVWSAVYVIKWYYDDECDIMVVL